MLGQAACTARGSVRWRRPATAGLLAGAGPAVAHDAGHGVPGLAEAWTLSPLVLVPLLLFAGLYGRGLWRLWAGGHAGRGISRPQALAAAAGVLALLLATVWPFDALGDWSLAAHMAQHMLLLAVLPPLLLAGRPWAAISGALPRWLAAGLHRLLHPAGAWLAARLAPATVAHAAVMVLWHLPGSLQAAVASEGLHEAMHASFLLAGLWFWTALWRRIRDGGAGPAPGVVATVALMMVMGFLGALLTFAPRPLYPLYAFRSPEVGLEPLADQQLAGLLMWVPSCLPYLAGALWLTWRGLGRLERGPGRADRRPPGASRRNAQ